VTRAGTYGDRWIACTEGDIRIRGYYFPWGSKRIPYAAVRSIRPVELSLLRGRGRLWGTNNPRYWAHLDPRRPQKQIALVLDIGRRVRPFLTPDDPDACLAVLQARCPSAEVSVTPTRGPLV
jgi:hypothetical protein